MVFYRGNRNEHIPGFQMFSSVKVRQDKAVALQPGVSCAPPLAPSSPGYCFPLCMAQALCLSELLNSTTRNLLKLLKKTATSLHGLI